MCFGNLFLLKTPYGLFFLQEFIDLPLDVVREFRV